MNPEQWPTGLAVTPGELAELMGLSVGDVRRLAASGLPCIRLSAEPGGGPPLVLHSLDAVRQWLVEREGVDGER